MSPRAAWRLEATGFGPVYDYVAGKADWLAADLPFEGTAQLAGMFTRRGVAKAAWVFMNADVQIRCSGAVRWPLFRSEPVWLAVTARRTGDQDPVAIYAT